MSPALSGSGRRNARYTPLDADGPLPADMVRAVPAIRRDPLAYLRGVVDRYGDLVAFPMPRTPVLLVNDPAGADRVLRDNHRAYGKATVQYRALSAVTGAGLLTADGDAWRARRRLAQPAFRHGALDGVATEAVAAGEALRRVWDDAGPRTPVDADGAAMRVMLDVVGRTLFAADLAPVADRVVTAVDTALHAVVHRSASPLALGPLGRLPTPRSCPMSKRASLASKKWRQCMKCCRGSIT
jgi:cytochrome P450